MIDDSEVEAPGTCHLETWMTHRNSTTGQIVANPACTPTSLTRLELGANSVYSWEPGTDAIAFGPAVKWNLRSSSSGFGVAVDASAVWSSVTERVESASLIVPLSMPIGKTVTANVNAGALWTRAHSTTAAFVGGQIMWQERKTLGFMVEAFERTDGQPGAQAGMRWNPDEKIDVDFLVSHAFDGSSHENATLGVTKRF